MAIQSGQARADAQQRNYLGLRPMKKRQQVARSTTGDADDVAETPKKKGSMLPILVGAAAVVFLMSQK